ncbi:hypothetical protein ACOMHN_028265 [Nucella lapillus]
MVCQTSVLSLSTAMVCQTSVSLSTAMVCQTSVLSLSTAMKSTLEIVEMKEIPLSPMPAIRNSHHPLLPHHAPNSVILDHSNLRMPPTFPPTTTTSTTTAFLSRGVGQLPSNTVRRRSGGGSSSGRSAPPRRRRLLSNFRQKAKQIKVKIPRVQDVNTIDRYARLLFPLLFVLFNASYWAIYLLT